MHNYVYRHGKVECHSLNIVRGIAIKLQVKFVKFETQLWPWVKVNVIGLAKTIYTFSRTIFWANVMGIAWKVSEIIEHLLLLLNFMIKICVNFNEGQGQDN